MISPRLKGSWTLQSKLSETYTSNAIELAKTYLEYSGGMPAAAITTLAQKLKLAESVVTKLGGELQNVQKAQDALTKS